MYVRQVDDQTLTLRVSGKLWMRSLIMSDIETGTEWSHLLGRAMAGKLKGNVLEPIVTDMLTWGAWKAEFPETTVLEMTRTSRHYSRDFYRDPRSFVFGFDLGGKPHALPMQQMIQSPVHQFTIDETPLLATFDKEATVTRLFERTVAGKVLEFTIVNEKTMIDKQTGSRWMIVSGEAVDGPLQGTQLKPRVGIMSYRKAWQNFHPTSKDVEF